jgi:hypothetical protein
MSVLSDIFNFFTIGPRPPAPPRAPTAYQFPTAPTPIRAPAQFTAPNPFDERQQAVAQRAITPTINTRVTAAANMYNVAGMTPAAQPWAPTQYEQAAQQAYEQNSLQAQLDGRGNPYEPSAQYPNGYYGYRPAGYGLTPQYETSPTHSWLTDMLFPKANLGSPEAAKGLPYGGVKNDTQDILPLKPLPLNDQYNYAPYQYPAYPAYSYGGGGSGNQAYAWMSKLLNWNVNK